MVSSESDLEEQFRAVEAQILLAVYDGMRAESLQHRGSISTAYGIAIAALLAIGGWAFTQDQLPLCQTMIVTGVSMLTGIGLLVLYIRRQRKESNKNMCVRIKIEDHFCLLKGGKYIEGSSILPQEWRRPPRTKWGLTAGDWVHVGSLLFLLVLVLGGLLWTKPFTSGLG
jgi:hypothetical protein